MAVAPERLRILLLLPARRRHDWQDRLAARLARGYDVVTVAVDLPAWPRALRRALGAGRGAPEPEPPGDFALVLDLSEHDTARSGRVFRPLYDGSPDTLALVGRLQRGECPLLDVEEVAGGAILASSFAAIGDTGRLEGRLDLAFARMEALLLRAVAGEGGALLADRPERAPAGFSTLGLLKARARRGAARLLAPLRRKAPVRHWNIALQADDHAPDIRHFDLDAYRPLPVDPTTFLADPFIFEGGEGRFLFAEAFPYATGKGVIVCADVGESAAQPIFRTILEQPWHLSYPFVFEWENQIYLAPEGSTHGGVEIYRATAFPWTWTLAHHVLPDWPLVDSTIFEHEGRLWLFAGAATPGGSDWDELFAWHAPGLDGPWTPHRLNPIKSDCRSARPGGRPLRIGGRLLRPAQRCERFYGEALAWLEIRTLTPDSFAEIELAQWRAEGPGLGGPHTADLSNTVKAIDYRALL